MSMTIERENELNIEFIRVKEYYGMPRGHLLSIYARFSGKKRT